VPAAEQRYDVLIIGGGLIGSSAAMHLAERGVKSIALVDADLGGRYSSSELNAGGVRATFRSELNIALSLASIEFYETVAEEVGFDQKGYLWLYDDERWPAAEAAMQLQNDRWKLGVEALATSEVAARYPFLDQLEGVRAATFSPRDGLLNPNLLKQVYRERARAAAGGGLHLKNYTYVVGVDVEADHVLVKAVHFQEFSPAGDQAIKAILCDAIPPEGSAPVSYRADLVINATGAWAARTAPLYGHPAPVRPIKRQIAIAHARDIDLRPYGMFVDTSGVYFHREATHMLAGYADPDTEMGYQFKYGGQEWFEEQIWPRLAARMSRCAEMRHRSGWSGLYEYTPDHSGILGFAPGADRIIEAFAFTGRGAMQSYAAGRAAAELAVSRRFEAIDLAALSPTRFPAGKLVSESLVI
jgi:glycine/D-amino acid oxidase-like deaminating enzyme